MSEKVRRSLGNVIRQIPASPSLRLRIADLEESQSSGSSFRYDPPDAPLKSTQQLPVDWSDFSKHVFFGSAEVAVNVAFDRIINGFPFDSNQSEADSFLDGITGYEKFIYDSFPKSINCLYLSQSYLAINDSAGATEQSISKRKDGSNVLDPGMSSFSVQFKLFVPEDPNDEQVICQRLSGSVGYSLWLENDAGTTNSNLSFMVTSGSAAILTSTPLKKGKWNDVCAQVNRRPTSNKLIISIDGRQVVTSSAAYELQEFQTKGTLLLVGSGVAHSSIYGSLTPTRTLSGSIDDFKFFIGNRTQTDIFNVAKYGTDSRSDIKAYYRFNEPSGSYSQQDLILDSSGNGLHTRIVNFTHSIRSKPHGLAFFYERDLYNPVLFPDYADLVSLNESLLLSASAYDEYNPNLITRLVPPHYLTNGMLSEGLDDEGGTIGDAYPSSGDSPRQTKLGSAQIMSSMLYVWAKQFDEYKLFLDQFSLLEDINHVATGSVADNFVPKQARDMGFELPKLFTPTAVRGSQYGDDVGIDPSVGTVPLTKIQTEVWRRIVATLPDVIASKGTIHSVKSLIRAFGVNPDTAIRIREYGGARSGFITGRTTKRDVIGELVGTGSWVASSPFLSASRVEPGEPAIQGSMTPAGSDNTSDGLFTSGSWTWESTVTFPTRRSRNEPESIVRFYNTGSIGNLLLLNLLCATSGSGLEGETNLTLHGSYDTAASNSFRLLLTGSRIFDGSRWNISFGRERLSETMSKWFLRAATEMAGEVAEQYIAESYVTSSNVGDVFSNINAGTNSSGSFFVIGNEPNMTPAALLLPLTDAQALTGAFSGNIAGLKFYSKKIDDSEWREHVRDVTSLGVKDPLTNFNFVTTASGSFQRLRIDVSMDQTTTGSDGSGNIELFDYSQNDYHLAGSGFPAGTQVIGNTDVMYSALEPKFDERSTTDKVRIRSWREYDNFVKWGGELGYAYEVPRNEEGSDDTRFGIEISVVQGMNEDIMRMFADHGGLDNAVGASNAMFDDTYPELEDLRNVYFNRLTDKPDFRNVFLFAKWFEDTIGSLVEQILPVNTRYFGTNFVVESHVLERNRMRYLWGDLYLGENDRMGLRGTIGLSQVLATIRRR